MPFNSETGRLNGQKTKRGVSERTKLLNQLLNAETTKAVWAKLEEKAKEGDNDCIKTYLAYCFGKPEAKLDLTSDGERIGYDLNKLSTDQLKTLVVIQNTLEGELN